MGSWLLSETHLQDKSLVDQSRQVFAGTRPRVFGSVQSGRHSTLVQNYRQMPERQLWLYLWRLGDGSNQWLSGQFIPQSVRKYLPETTATESVGPQRRGQRRERLNLRMFWNKRFETLSKDWCLDYLKVFLAEYQSLVYSGSLSRLDRHSIGSNSRVFVITMQTLHIFWPFCVFLSYLKSITFVKYLLTFSMNSLIILRINALKERWVKKHSQPLFYGFNSQSILILMFSNRNKIQYWIKIGVIWVDWPTLVSSAIWCRSHWWPIVSWVQSIEILVSFAKSLIFNFNNRLIELWFRSEPVIHRIHGQPINGLTDKK